MTDKLTQMTPCNCTLCGPTGRCPEANALWEAANAIYRSQGYDAWTKALEPYSDHIWGAIIEDVVS